MRHAGSSAESQLGLPEYRGHSRGEKVAFALLVLFIVGAALGLFGDGPLSSATVDSADGQLHVVYERFGRREAPQTLDLTVPTRQGSNEILLQVNGEYLQRVHLSQIVPAPLQATHHRVGELRFATDGSGEPMTVRLHLEAQESGRLQARFSVASSSVRTAAPRTEVQFQQIVYP